MIVNDRGSQALVFIMVVIRIEQAQLDNMRSTRFDLISKFEFEQDFKLDKNSSRIRLGWKCVCVRNYIYKFKLNFNMIACTHTITSRTPFIYILKFINIYK